MHSSKRVDPRLLPVCTALLAVLAFTPAASGQSLSKAFNPSTIGPGSTSTLTFTLSNPSGSGLRGATLTDALPAGMTLASPAAAESSCFGTLTAPDGGTTITYSGGGLPGNSTCTISVNVTASGPGTYTNTSGSLTWDAGSAPGASADLTVATDRPGFTKSFSPANVFFGGRTTLTFTIDNSANDSDVFGMRFTDTLPSTMAVADPASASSTCTGGSITAVPGSNSISYSSLGGLDALVNAGAICTISVDVQANAIGTLGNTSGNLTGQRLSGFALVDSGMASATLTSTIEQIAVSKNFVDDPVAPGATVTLEFTVRNLDRRNSASNISFSDDLDATLTGLVAVGLPSNPCGAGSSLTGSSTLVLSGGNLGTEQTCTFSATLQVPSDAVPGTYVNTTSSISADFDGSPVIGDPASDLLFVQPVPVLTKTFLDNPVGGGGTTVLEFTITNSSLTSSATDITFTDVFETIHQTAAAVPAAGFCGAGSTATFTPWLGGISVTPARLTVTGANLAPAASCTFSITLDVSENAPAGTYNNTTSEITATVDGETITGDAASDDLQVVAPPQLEKEFIDDPVQPGDNVTLRFTLRHLESAPAAVTDVSFTDDLDATLSGLVATSLPSTPCGAGSSISGTMTLLFTGGSLDIGESCTFDVALQAPAAAAPGAYTNTTSSVVGTVLGISTVGNAASDDLRIAGLSASKEFINDPVLPGGTVTLRYTFTNDSPTDTASSILLQDNLGSALDGLAAASVPSEPCGAGSSLAAVSGGTFLFLQNGVLAPAASCTFDVPLTVPASTPPDTYISTTSLIAATFNATLITFDNISDRLLVETNFLSLSKEFVDDPAGPGDAVTLRFTIDNLNASEAVADIAFTDDLNAALSGLAASGAVLTDVCGIGSQLSGSSLLTFSGGSLAAGASCTFDVALTVPTDVSLGTEATNTTSTITGTIGGLAVEGGTASDVLQIDFMAFSKSFSGSVEAGDTVTLVFNLENLSGDTINLLSFTDDLGAMLPGLTAVGLPATDICGEGSSLEGTTALNFNDGSLLPGGSCSFGVTLQVPGSAAVGDYLNETSELTRAGEVLATPATATLTIFEVVIVDSDGDGVLDGDDVCPGTTIPEGVPTRGLKKNRYALTDGDTIFDSLPGGAGDVFTTTDTAGCSCEQIIEAQGLGNGHTKFGCSIGAMREWVNLVKQPNAGGYIGRPHRESRGN